MRKAFGEARSVARDWLALPASRGDSWNTISAQIDTARLWTDEEKWDEAWKAIEPVVGSWRGRALRLASKIQYRRGHKDEARKLAQDCLERYPDDEDSMMLLVEFDWRDGGHASAAKRFGDWKAPYSRRLLSLTIPTAVMEVFGGNNEAAAAAIDELISTKNDYDFVLLVEALAYRSGDDLAFRVADAIGRRTNLPSKQLAGFRYKLRKDGRAAAGEWARGAFRPGKLGPDSFWIYRSGAYELLWDSVGDISAKPEAEKVWIYRAAAAARIPSELEAHRKVLVDHFSATAPAGHEGKFEAGRFLLGLISETELLSRSTTARRMTAAAWALGTRADVENRPKDAIAWWRISFEAGTRDDVEAFQSRYDLADLKNSRLGGIDAKRGSW